MQLTDVHAILNNAYILFSFALGAWCIIKLLRGQTTLDGNFWGAVVLCTGLAAAGLLLAVVLALTGVNARRWAYYLYAVFFVIVLPGTFSLLRGRDDRLAVIIFGIVTFFAGASATRVPLLVEPWDIGG